jgi:hypothetical protein
VVKAIEFANDGGWHVGDEEARLRYLADVIAHYANREQRIEDMVELAIRYKRNLLYIAMSLSDIELCA